MSENRKDLENLFPTLKMPSGQMFLIGIRSCTFLGTLNFSLSCARIALMLLIIVLGNLLFAFIDSVLQRLVVDIHRLESDLPRLQHFAAEPIPHKLLCGHAVVVHKAHCRKGCSTKDAH